MAQKGQHLGNGKTKCSIRTTTKMHEIRSTVENVSKLPCGIEAIGPDFYLTPECMASISFVKQLNHLFVYICNKSDTEIKIESKIVLSDCNNQKLHEVEDKSIWLLIKDMNVIGCVKKGSSYDNLTNDTLIIDVCVSIKGIVRKRINHFLSPLHPGRKLSEDLKTMLENPVNSDVCLKVGDEQIPAHWSLLCSRSSYFKRMFDSQMKERVQNSITITDSSLSTVKTLIQFLYTADFVEKDDLQKLYDLYYVADKYEVFDMRTLCATKIMDNATADNVCQIFQFAHRHNDKDFKMEAMHFMQLHSEAVFQTDGWKQFEASEPLAAEFISFFCSK